MIATPPEAYEEANAVPHLQEAIQRYYQEIDEEEPPQIDVTNDEQVAFDAIRDHVINNLALFNNNDLAVIVIEEFAGGMHGGSRNKTQRSYRKKRSTRRKRRSTRRKSYRKKTHKRK